MRHCLRSQAARAAAVSKPTRCVAGIAQLPSEAHRRHLLRPVRRCSVSSQRWSAGVTPPPLIARTNRKRLLLSPGKRSRIVSWFCMSHVIATHAVIKSPLNAFHQAQNKLHGHTAFSHFALTSHVARLFEFALHTAHHDRNCFRNSYSHRHWIAISRLILHIGKLFLKFFSSPLPPFTLEVNLLIWTKPAIKRIK